MTEGARNKSWAWAIAFLVAMGAMAVAIKVFHLFTGTAAVIAMLTPTVLLVPMVREGMKHGAPAGESGTAMRRYIKRMALLMGAYMLILFGVVTRFNNGNVGDTSAVIMAILPGLPIVGVFWAMGRLLVELKDEFQRMLMVRQIIIATGFALSIASVHGFLTTFEVLPRVDGYWAPVLFFLGLFVGQVANRLKYGVGGACA